MNSLFYVNYIIFSPKRKQLKQIFVSKKKRIKNCSKKTQKNIEIFLSKCYNVYGKVVIFLTSIVINITIKSIIVFATRM